MMIEQAEAEASKKKIIKKIQVNLLYLYVCVTLQCEKALWLLGGA